MANYKDSYFDRNVEGNNIAETRCVEFLDSRENFYWCKFGFDGWKIPFKHFIKIPDVIRKIPDYVGVGRKAFFLECKGYKGFLKIKEDDFRGYSYWNGLMELYFFAYDCDTKTSWVVSYKKINTLIDDLSEIGRYPDNKKIFYKIRTEDIRRCGKQV